MLTAGQAELAADYREKCLSCPALHEFQWELAWNSHFTYSWRAKVNSPRCTRNPPL